ncbi:unnamed protein product (mitochondrion) [Plasmodiophora brassicae]|uniref:Uncharacterized protein n=1 Tax=Plasmodiophora brassicae TaxID=37360 RepID=A0A3P3XYK3_PLABS|nr:unnamed protein product [Plasmodiophora brassicae]
MSGIAGDLPAGIPVGHRESRPHRCGMGGHVDGALRWWGRRCLRPAPMQRRYLIRHLHYRGLAMSDWTAAERRACPSAFGLGERARSSSSDYLRTRRTAIQSAFAASPSPARESNCCPRSAPMSIGNRVCSNALWLIVVAIAARLHDGSADAVRLVSSDGHGYDVSNIASFIAHSETIAERVGYDPTIWSQLRDVSLEIGNVKVQTAIDFVSRFPTLFEYTIIGATEWIQDKVANGQRLEHFMETAADFRMRSLTVAVAWAVPPDDVYRLRIPKTFDAILPYPYHFIAGIARLRDISDHHGFTQLALCISERIVVRVPDANIKVIAETRFCGCTNVLVWAAHHGEVLILEVLLDLPGFGTNAVLGTGSWTALHYAAMGGQANLVVALLKRPGIDANLKDSQGWTPLHCAAFCGHTGVVQALLDQNSTLVDTSPRDRHGNTPLLWASTYGHSAVESLMKNRGVTV